MFFNDIYEQTYSNETIKSNHRLFYFSKGINHTAIFLFFIPLFLLKKRIIRKSLKLCFKKMDQVDEKWNFTIDFDENLGCYWNCLSATD